MREKLKELEGQRLTFTGRFVRVGEKMDYRGAPAPTVVLEDLCDAEGNYLTDHIWMNLTLGFKRLGRLKPGDIIQVDATVQEYGKDYRFDEDNVCRFHKYDYGLTRPAKLKKLDKRRIKDPS